MLVLGPNIDKMRAQIRTYEYQDPKLRSAIAETLEEMLSLPSVDCKVRRIGNKMLVIYAPLAHPRDFAFIQSLSDRSNVRPVQWVYGWEDVLGFISAAFITFNLLRKKTR